MSFLILVDNPTLLPFLLGTDVQSHSWSQGPDKTSMLIRTSKLKLNHAKLTISL